MNNGNISKKSSSQTSPEGKGNKKRSNSSDYSEEQDVDDIINQHLMEEEQSNKKVGGKGGSSSSSIEEEDDLYEDENEFEDPIEPKDLAKKAEKAKREGDDDENYDYIDDSLNLNVKSPKQTLIEHLRLLADIFNANLDGESDYYDQVFDERA